MSTKERIVTTKTQCERRALDSVVVLAGIPVSKVSSRLDSRDGQPEEPLLTAVTDSLVIWKRCRTATSGYRGKSLLATNSILPFHLLQDSQLLSKEEEEVQSWLVKQADLV
ncbi:uncharacterized protein LOC144310896 [Canis aureus]